jgi:uncharacterized membrane-anchored protein
MRKFLIFVAVCLQFSVLGFMAVQREIMLRTGKTIHLRTAPVDPRDPMRGDYIDLQYDISSIPFTRIRGNIDRLKSKKAVPVYTVLRETPEGLAELDYCTEEKPLSGLFISGQTFIDWRFFREQCISVKYGIETYYVEQGKGRKIEQRRGSRNSIQTPMEMAVSLTRDGKALIKGYSWSSLGIGIEIIRPPAAPRQQTLKSPKVKLTLANSSDKPLALVNMPQQESFTLEPAFFNPDIASAYTPPEISAVCEGHIIILAPGETKTFDFDLADKRWFVKKDGKNIEVCELDPNGMFRIVYIPPSDNECQHLKDKNLIWHGHLPSQAFNASGRID